MPTITDWLMVGITIVYVIATILICIFNYKATKESQIQTKEMRREFLLANRPIVTVSIIYVKRSFWALRFTNVGPLTAFNCKIELEESFVKALPEEKFRRILESQKGKCLIIGPTQQYDLFFGTNKYISNIEKPHLRGKISYNGCDKSIYVEDFSIAMENYATSFSVDSDADDFKKILSEQNKQLKEICDLLKFDNGET